MTRPGFKTNETSARVAFVLGAVLCFAAQGATAARHVVPVRQIEFTQTPVPSSMTEQTKVFTRSQLIVTLLDGTRQTFPLHYHILYNSGEQVGLWRAGTIVDKTGAALSRLLDDKGKLLSKGPFYAHSPDANSLIAHGTALNLITHFEYDTEAPSAQDPKRMIDLYDQLPMVMNRAVLKQQCNGLLKAIALHNVNMDAVAGIWNPCAGELTPWNTHLGGEEYEPDARTYEQQPLTTMNRFLGTPGRTAQQGGANPYRYGFITEVKLDAHGKTQVVKHYAMGRQSNELAHVLPDGRTAYKGDDGRDQVLTMFVADRAGDLSAGTLYAAQVQQLEASHGGKFALRWIKLGHARDTQIATLIKRGIRFSDIFESVSAARYAAKPDAYPGYRPVYVYTGTHGTNSDKLDYLKLKPGMQQAAAFLETRRYAAYLGATTEFTKMEGVTSNNADRRLYIAMSYVEGGMLAGHNADRPRDDIHLNDDPKDLKCGVVYQARLRDSQHNSDGKHIDSAWVATDLSALVMGARKPPNQPYGKFDRCDSDKVANPDNIKFSEVWRTLFIGEDSSNHMNNFLWAYRVDTQRLTRIASGRFGQEWTGLATVENLNGYGYILSNVQHPGATQDTARYKSLLTAAGIDFDALRNAVDKRGAVGYFGSFPAFKLVPTH
jgi:secreted PhoX family phosphatase